MPSISRVGRVRWLPVICVGRGMEFLSWGIDARPRIGASLLFERWCGGCAVAFTCGLVGKCTPETPENFDVSVRQASSQYLSSDPARHRMRQPNMYKARVTQIVIVHRTHGGNASIDSKSATSALLGEHSHLR